jgi:hypothetical protein
VPPPNNSAGFTFALFASFANASTSEFSDLLEALSKSKLTLSGEVIKMMECLTGQRIIAFGFSRSIRPLLLQPLKPLLLSVDASVVTPCSLIILTRAISFAFGVDFMQLYRHAQKQKILLSIHIWSQSKPLVICGIICQVFCGFKWQIFCGIICQYQSGNAFQYSDCGIF